MASNFNTPEGNLEEHFVDEYFLIDQYIGDTLLTWGYNAFAQLGTNGGTDRLTPVTTLAGGSNWKQVSGALSATAIKTDGTLWTWGRNANGQLGVNDTTNRGTPVQVFGNHTNWKQVSSGGYPMAAIKTDGTLWTWGSNIDARLGTNDTTQRNTPVTTFAGGTNWKQVSAGYSHCAAIKTDGTLWNWGRGNDSQLGDNTITTKSTPVTTFAGGTNWKQVSAGGFHTAAIKTDGTLWVWGYNNVGQLGINDTTNRNTPVTTFAGGTNWKRVNAGYQSSTTAIKTDGTLWTWGSNAYGGLGTNDTTQRLTPVTTFAGGTNWKQSSNGRGQTAAIKTDGTLWTWGSNAYGGLGTNDNTQRLTPVTTFAGGTNWKQVADGHTYFNTVAITSGTDPTFFVS
jgi:alpha-tubulin suppressor-like RCC1 family protein